MVANQEEPLHGSSKAQQQLSRRALDGLRFALECQCQGKISQMEVCGEYAEEEKYMVLLFPESALLWLLDSAARAHLDPLTYIKRALLERDEFVRRGLGDNSIIKLTNPGKDIQPPPIEFSW